VVECRRATAREITDERSQSNLNTFFFRKKIDLGAVAIAHHGPLCLPRRSMVGGCDGRFRRVRGDAAQLWRMRTTYAIIQTVLSILNGFFGEAIRNDQTGPTPTGALLGTHHARYIGYLS
jgi:hypothetical protein